MQAILLLQMSGSHISFTVPHYINEKELAFKFCIENIIRRIRNMRPVVNSNETIHISTILHTAVSLLKGLVILPQMEVSGDESSGHVDYAIKFPTFLYIYLLILIFIVFVQLLILNKG